MGVTKTRNDAGHHRCFVTRRGNAPARAALTAVSLLFATPASAQLDPPAWTRPTAPFRILGDIWYVGTEGLAAYLIKTPRGAILLDATMAENVPAIEANIVATGTKLRDVKYLLVSHAHFDHAAGDAAMVAATGAKVVAGVGDVAALESGIPPGEVSYGVIKFPPVKVSRGVRDGDTLSLGGTTLTAIATPGHTPGNTSWTMRQGKLTVVFPGSLTVAGNLLVGNKRYPGIVPDFRASFARMAGVKADVVLPAHPELADVIGRSRRGETYVAPGLLPEMVAKARVAFDADLAKQHAAVTPPAAPDRPAK